MPREEYQQAVAKTLRSLRAESRSKQEVIANLLQINQSQYSRIESGKRSLAVEDLIPLARHFGTTPSDLVKRFFQIVTSEAFSPSKTLSPTSVVDALNDSIAGPGDPLAELFNGEAPPDFRLLKLLAALYVKYPSTT